MGRETYFVTFLVIPKRLSRPAPIKIKVEGSGTGILLELAKVNVTPVEVAVRFQTPGVASKPPALMCARPDPPTVTKVTPSPPVL